MRFFEKWIFGLRRRWVAVIASVLAGCGALAAQPPAGYYDPVDAADPVSLRHTLHDVIDDHTRFTYSDSDPAVIDTWEIVNLADQDPGDPNRVVDLYRNASFDEIPGGTGPYQREHVWPKSYGFPDLRVGNYPYTDCHHLFAAYGSYNGSRSNRPFRTCESGCQEKATLLTHGRGGGEDVRPGNSNWTTGEDGELGTWEAWDGRKGDVARAIFYMDVRYDGGHHGGTGSAEPDLIVTDVEAMIAASETDENEPVAYMGMKSTLLDWHHLDPVDDRERWRNEAVYAYQGNRNPFIDHPEWADCLHADRCGDAADSTPPAAPTGLMATAGAGAIDLLWNSVADGDLAGYHVYRATGAGAWARITLSAVGEPFLSDRQALRAGTTYRYVVRAVDAASNLSGDSNQVEVTPSNGCGGGVILSEVLYDVDGSDDGYEWVELYNSGSGPVDLSGYCLGNGGDDYAVSTVQLSGMVGGGTTFVVGGPFSGMDNGRPVFDQEIDFDPDFQNSGSTGDGVALFGVPCAQVGAATVPLDAVVYGPDNASGLIDETGAAGVPEVGDAPAGSSLERTDLAGNWQIRPDPTPNRTSLPLPSANQPPAVTITAPADGATFTEGSPIAFSGSAFDPEDGDLTPGLRWSSSLQRTLGSGGSFTRTLAVGTHVITAAVSDGCGLEASDSITIEVIEDGGDRPRLFLTEIFYDAGGADDGLEWVELYNAGADPVDLAGMSLGNGGDDYAYSRVQLSGTVAPGATFVVGGPASSAANGSPEFDLTIDFDPDFQNSGSVADGVALFDVPAAEVTAATVPIDAVVYGPVNASGLIDEHGSASAPEVGDAPAGFSIGRYTAGGEWRIQRHPTPGVVCLADEHTACLLDGRFRVDGVMTDFSTPPLEVATRVMTFPGGRAESDKAVFFESFGAGNFEVGVKMVDACSLPDGHPLRAHWAFFGGLTNAETEIAVADTVTGQVYGWSNGAGEFPLTLGDTGAFPCIEGSPAMACVRGDHAACLLDGRFRVTGSMTSFDVSPEEVPVRVMSFPGGRAESAQAVFFESFDAGNFEVGVKMVDACSLPVGDPLRFFWVFYGGLTNAGTTLRVKRLATGEVDEWSNPSGVFPRSVGRTNAFPCD